MIAQGDVNHFFAGISESGHEPQVRTVSGVFNGSSEGFCFSVVLSTQRGFLSKCGVNVPAIISMSRPSGDLYCGLCLPVCFSRPERLIPSRLRSPLGKREQRPVRISGFQRDFR